MSYMYNVHGSTGKAWRHVRHTFHDMFHAAAPLPLFPSTSALLPLLLTLLSRYIDLHIFLLSIPTSCFVALFLPLPSLHVYLHILLIPLSREHDDLTLGEESFFQSCKSSSQLYLLHHSIYFYTGETSFTLNSELHVLQEQLYMV